MILITFLLTSHNIWKCHSLCEWAFQSIQQSTTWRTREFLLWRPSFRQVVFTTAMGTVSPSLSFLGFVPLEELYSQWLKASSVLSAAHLCPDAPLRVNLSVLLTRSQPENVMLPHHGRMEHWSTGHSQLLEKLKDTIRSKKRGPWKNRVVWCNCRESRKWTRELGK
jgi:hypothetical protein